MDFETEALTEKEVASILEMVRELVEEIGAAAVEAKEERGAPAEAAPPRPPG